MPIAHFKANLQLIHGPLACDIGAELGPAAAGEVLGALEVDVEGAFLGEHIPDNEPRGALDEARHLDGPGRPAVVVPARPWDGPMVADVVSTAGRRRGLGSCYCWVRRETGSRRDRDRRGDKS